MRRIIFTLALLISSVACCAEVYDSVPLQQVPAAYQGRFRPLDAASRIWLEQIYGRQKLRQKHLSAFEANSGSALPLLWRLHFHGYTHWKDAPLFYLDRAEFKQALGLPANHSHFSYRTLEKQLLQGTAVASTLLPRLVRYAYHKQSEGSTDASIELTSLAPGLFVQRQGSELLVTSVPDVSPWKNLPANTVISAGKRSDSRRVKDLYDDTLDLIARLNHFTAMKGIRTVGSDYERLAQQLQEQAVAPSAIASRLREAGDLTTRLKQAGNILHLLPSASQDGVWLPIAALKLKTYHPDTNSLQRVSNFTLFDNDVFQQLQTEYLNLEQAELSTLLTPVEKAQQTSQSIAAIASLLQQGYAQIEGTAYSKGKNRQLTYPSTLRLRAERLYYRLPLIPVTVTLYAIAMLAFLMGTTLHSVWLNRIGTATMLCAFGLHSAVLAMRCYVLTRPPVSNMFETVLYVPWVGVLVSLPLVLMLKSRAILVASAMASVILLLLIKTTGLDGGLDNVQAVLDSQYWLLVHVLMVVGSYGIFALSGVLAHFYLGWAAIRREESPRMERIGAAILQTLYLGTALLICGTILGGVWAAESWGRFWDWDPKESWAFISSCLYLIVVHLYRFGLIGRFGLAVGAVFGLAAISFTWYGVNYILGTGLHSYGFGSGGELYYYLYLLAELAFVGIACAVGLKQRKGLV